MTGRTHDLAAFTAVSYVAVTHTLEPMSLATLIVSFTACMVGGLAPDIDQPTADLWHRLPAGGIIGRIFTPFLGGHRFISHSILGIFIFGFLARMLLDFMAPVVLVNMTIVWWAFMIGFLSHLVMDTFTREAVPWLFPIPIHIGIPPFKALRIKTGSMVEKSIVFPGLLLLTFWIYYANYHKVLDFLRHYIK